MLLLKSRRKEVKLWKKNTFNSIEKLQYNAAFKSYVARHMYSFASRFASCWFRGRDFHSKLKDNMSRNKAQKFPGNDIIFHQSVEHEHSSLCMVCRFTKSDTHLIMSEVLLVHPWTLMQPNWMESFWNWRIGKEHG